MSVSAMAIPPLNRTGELPAGEHKTSLGDKAFRALVSTTGRVRKIWINGSFVRSKKEPNDVDGCWEYTENVNIGRLDPVFLAESRLPMKEKYGVEFFPAFVIEAGSGLPFPKFFQVNRDGDRKGILVVSFT